MAYAAFSFSQRKRYTAAMKNFIVTLGVLGCLFLSSCVATDVDGDGYIRIYCLGDSNTKADWPLVGVHRWCEYAAALRPTAGMGLPAIWTNVSIIGGSAWLSGTIETQAALDGHADVVVLALGTNDAGIGRTVTDVVTDLQTMHNAQPAGVLVLVGLLPPITGAHPVDVTPYNAAIKAAFPYNWVDFYTNMTTTDGVHVDDVGQHLRAQKVVEKIAP